MREAIISREMNIYENEVVIYDTTINATRVEKVSTFEPLTRKQADKVYNTATATVVAVNEIAVQCGIYEMPVSKFLTFATPVTDRRGIVTKEVTTYRTAVTIFYVSRNDTGVTVLKDIKTYDFKSASKMLNGDGKTVVKVEPLDSESAVYGMSYKDFMYYGKPSNRVIKHG